MILKVFLCIFYNLDPSKARFFFVPASGARDALVSILEGCAHKHYVRDVTMHTSVTSDEVKYTPYVSCARHFDAYGHLAQLLMRMAILHRKYNLNPIYLKYLFMS